MNSGKRKASTCTTKTMSLSLSADAWSRRLDFLYRLLSATCSGFGRFFRCLLRVRFLFSGSMREVRVLFLIFFRFLTVSLALFALYGLRVSGCVWLGSLGDLRRLLLVEIVSFFAFVACGLLRSCPSCACDDKERSRRSCEDCASLGTSFRTFRSRN